MPEPAATQILATKVVSDGSNAARVDITIADAASLEEATESVSLSVRIKLENETRPLADYQRQAVKRAVEFLSEHWRSLDQLLSN